MYNIRKHNLELDTVYSKSILQIPYYNKLKFWGEETENSAYDRLHVEHIAIVIHTYFCSFDVENA